MSKKITLAADKATATIADAGSMDFLSTILSSDVAVTGTQKYIQLGAVAAAGAIFMNKRHTGNLFDFGG